MGPLLGVRISSQERRPLVGTRGKLSTQRRQLCVWAVHTEVVRELNPAVLHLQQLGTPTCREFGTGSPSSSVVDFEPR